MDEKAGLYIHIPFCRSKCPYCDFFSVKYEKGAAQRYVRRVLAEFENYEGAFDTVYFGGGTPGILEPEQIVRIIDGAKRCFAIDKNAEITVECNPSKDMARDFELYAKNGVNRISIGMQSAVDRERFALGRSAGRTQVAKAVEDAKRAGIQNISLDLMLGTPRQTLESLDFTFDFIEQTDVSHISAYMLKIEEGTKFFEMKNRLPLPDEDTVSDMYLKTVSALSAMGFAQYEISNFAKPGFESRHNLKYWRLIPYLGVGCAAYSFWQGRRFYYDRNFNKIDDGAGGDRTERIMLGLRLSEGIDKALLKDGMYKKFVKMGLMNETENKISLTAQGMLLSNVIISALL